MNAEPIMNTEPALSDTAQRFAKFHYDNPQVYHTLVRLAREAKARGLKHLGVRMLWEVARWDLTLKTVDASSAFKLNDHYTSRYVRLIIANEPDLASMFNLRELRS